MSDDNPQGEQGPIGGRRNSRLSEVKASFKVDTQQLNSLKRHLEDVQKTVRALRDDMDQLAAATAKVTGGVSGASIPGKGRSIPGFPSALGATRISTSQPITGQASATATALGAASTASSVTDKMLQMGQAAGRVHGAFRAAGGGMAGARAAVGASGVGAGLALAAYNRFEAGVSALNAAVDSRIERGIEYATSADRLNMLTQQMYGMSQMEVMEGFRRPLTEYRLGAGGISAMVQFQTETGVEASAELGQSLAGIRAATGYSKSTQQILSQQRSLMDPRIANRMLFMAGTNAYEYGGGMRDPMQMRQELIRNLGLDNERVLSGAFAPGSVTRARMADLGIGEEMQTELLQMARQQVEFTRKGGEGAYDPSLVEHRELMGVEGNLVSQQEETTRREVQREENFMRRQIDNMATREKIDRQLIVVLGKLEDTLSGIVGGKITIGQTGNRALGFLGSIPGKVFNAAGSLLGVGDGPPGPSVRGAGVNAAGASDSSRDSQIQVPSRGRGSSKTTLSQLKQRPDVAKLHPSLKERLFKMMRVNPNVGITSGYRDDYEQESVFLDKMEPVSDEEAKSIDKSLVTEWKGQKYAPKDGENFAAAPGRSVHSLGLAADIFEEGDNGSYSWIVSNSARFGLNNWRAKGWRHDEPWHVQPDSVPRNFSDIVAAGLAEAPDVGSYAGEEDAREYHENYRMGGGPTSTSGMSTSEIIESERSKAREVLGMRGSTGTGNAAGKDPSAPGGPKGASPVQIASGEAMSPEDVARIAHKAGFTGEALVNMVAIAGRESGYRPRAHNTDNDVSAMTGDFGLWQINYTNVNDSLLRTLGIADRSGLFDPYVNARAAYILSSGGTNLNPWGYDPDKREWSAEGDPMAGTNVEAARAAVSSAGLGDATTRSLRLPTKSSSGKSSGGNNRGGPVSVTNSPTINVSPTINFNGTPQTPDLQSIAITVSRMIEKEVKMLDLRSS